MKSEPINRDSNARTLCYWKENEKVFINCQHMEKSYKFQTHAQNLKAAFRQKRFQERVCSIKP